MTTAFMSPLPWIQSDSRDVYPVTVRDALIVSLDDGCFDSKRNKVVLTVRLIIVTFLRER
jgi:hypothetical protein